MKRLTTEELVARHLVAADLYVLMRKTRGEDVEPEVRTVIEAINGMKAEYALARSKSKKWRMTITLAQLMAILDGFVPKYVIPYTNRLLHDQPET